MAEQCQLEALNTTRLYQGENNELYITSLTLLASLYVTMEKYIDADSLFQISLAGWEMLKGKNNWEYSCH